MDYIKNHTDELLGLIFKSGPTGLAVVESDFRFRQVNGALCRITGYSREELLERKLTSLMHADGMGLEAECKCEAFGKNIAPDGIEKHCSKKNGDILWIKLTLKALHAANETGGCCLAIIEDVTQRTRLAKSLELVVEGPPLAAGQSYFRTLARYLANRLQVRHAFISEALEPIEEGRHRVLAMWDGEQFTAGFDYDIKGTPCEQVFAGGAAYFPADVRKLFPTDHWLRDHDIESFLGIRMRDSEGTPIGHLAVMHDRRMSQDVLNEEVLRASAARAGAELEQYKARRSLIRSEQLYRGLFDNAVEAMVTIGEQGIIRSVNPALLCMFGYQSKDLLGKNIKILMPSPYHEAHDGYLADYLKTGEKKIIGIGRETMGRRRDGTIFPVHLSVVESNVEEHRMFTGFLKDLTEIRRAQEERRKAKEEAEAMNRELRRAVEQANQLALKADLANSVKSTFLANMSHELRTPMSGVIGMNELLLETRMTEQQREYAETIRDSAEHLLKIIDDILEISQIEAEKIKIDCIDFDPRSIVEAVTDSIAPEAKAKGLRVTCIMQAKVPPMLRGDPGRMRQILMNIAGNAVKFTREGEIVISTSLEEDAPTHATIRCMISDTGIGIAEDKIEKVFQLFTQADESSARKHGGTGLGLTIAKELCRLMGGEIKIQSDPGQGTKVSFTMRFEKTERESSCPPEIHAEIHGLRILVVNGNASYRNMLERQIASFGCNPVVVGRGDEALPKLTDAASASRPFQLAIIDSNTPDMDVRDLARRIESDPVLHTPPLVVLTLAGKHGDAALMREAGFCAYLTKPFTGETLMDCIAAVTGGARGGNGTARSKFITRHSLDEARRSRRSRILLAEDNLVNQRSTACILGKFGLRCDVVANGREAWEAQLRSPYDIVLMDCRMPEMDGYEAARKIRQDEGGAHRTAIIALTEKARETNRERCLAAGMDDYLCKPFTPKALETILEKWLAKIGHARPFSTSIESSPPRHQNLDLMIFGGYARLPDSVGGKSGSRMMSLELEVNIGTKKIINASWSIPSGLATEMTIGLLVGHNLDDGVKDIVLQIQLHYHGAIQRALVACVEDAYRYYTQYMRDRGVRRPRVIPI